MHKKTGEVQTPRNIEHNQSYGGPHEKRHDRKQS